MTTTDKASEIIDRFYVDHGPCCAGCDWWRYANSVAGECTRYAPMPAEQRYSMLGMQSISAPIGAGHPLTPRDHFCGDFKDDFDWSTLPLPYLHKIAKKKTK